MACTVVWRPYRIASPHPVRTARGVLATRQGAVLSLTWPCGLLGIGEAAGWPGFGVGPDGVDATGPRVHAELQRWALAAPSPREAVPQDIRAADGTRWAHEYVDAQWQAIHQKETWPSEWRHAFEVALFDALGRAADRPMATLLCEEASDTVWVHALVGSAVEAQRACRAGIRAIKAKIGYLPLDDEGARIAGIRAAIGDKVGLRLDANGAWPLDRAQKALRMLAAISPEWIEEPLAPEAFCDLPALREQNAIPIALDEQIGDAPRLLHALHTDAADVYVIKPMFVGGPRRALHMAEQVARAGRAVCVTHAMEATPAGQLAALHVAAAIDGRLRRAFGAAAIKAAGVSTAARPAQAGQVRVPAGAGLGLAAAAVPVGPSS